MSSSLPRKDQRLTGVYRLLSAEHGPPPAPPAKQPKCLDLLIAFALAQNTQPANARSAFKQLKRNFTSWHAVMNAPVREVVRCLAVCGLARMRARRLQAMLRTIHAWHGALDLEFLRHYSPADAYDYLMGYYGIGPKTAAATLLFAFDMPFFPVDQRMHRMCRRLRIVRAKAGVAETSRAIEGMIPHKRCYPLHVMMAAHAKAYCRPRNPKCRACSLAKLCPSGQLRLRHRQDKNVPTVRARPVILSRFASDGLSKRCERDEND
jgi:endonuclease-3